MQEWDGNDLAAVAQAYRRHHLLADGDRRDRLAAEEHFWAWEVVQARVQGPEAMAMLEALLNVSQGDEGFLSYVGAGPVEDMIDDADFAAAVAARCGNDPRWATVLASVAVSRTEWEALPPPLQALIPEVSVEPEHPTKLKKTQRRASKRQGPRGRR